MALLVLTWSALTPGFRPPDEREHVNSVWLLACGDGWSAPGERVLTVATETATAEAGYGSRAPGSSAAPISGYGDFAALEPIESDGRYVRTCADATTAGASVACRK